FSVCFDYLEHQKLIINFKLPKKIEPGFNKVLVSHQIWSIVVLVGVLAATPLIFGLNFRLFSFNLPEPNLSQIDYELDIQK
ncbi:hypothetical protein BpHYR1_005448, partial [Brachionus plicatilis]